MSEFKSALQVRLLPEGGDPVWQLITPLVYQSDLMGVVTVPAEFITNFVSFEPLKNVGHRAAVVHDYLYSCCDVERELADRILREALDCTGVEPQLVEAMFVAVRLFGGGHKENTYSFYQEGK